MSPLALCPPDDVLLSSLEGGSDGNPDWEHVRQCGRCQQRLDQLRREILALSLISTDAQSLDQRSSDSRSEDFDFEAPLLSDFPNSIGRYRVICELQGGGQSQVFRVVHPTLDVELIAKVGKNVVDRSNQSRDLLIAEGKRLAAISHPQIAQVMDMDLHEGRPFVVMEFVRGATLRKILETQNLSWGESVSIVRKIALALQIAHDNAVLHQDLKPENIIIDGSGNPKLIDFGLALNFGVWMDETTSGSRVAGTLGYISPEQAEGDLSKLDTRTDVFNLGAVLFEMLAGDTPFCRNPVKQSLEASKACEIDFTTLLRKRVPRSLIHICKRTLAKERSQRFQSAAEFAAALEGFQRSQIVARRSVVVGAALIVLLPLAYLMMTWYESVSVENRSEEMSVSVFRNNHVYELRDSVPLTKKDEIQIEVQNIPKNQSVGLILIGSDRSVKYISSDECQIDRQGGRNMLRYPKGGRSQTLDNHGGTECILFVSSRTPSEALKTQTVQQVIETQEWPSLSEHAVVSISTAGVNFVVQDRGFGGDIENQNAKAQDRLEKLRIKLLEHFDSFTGLVFSHLEP